MDIFIITLVATNLAASDMATVNSTLATAYKDAKPIEWVAQPTETKDGVTYFRNVAFQKHLADNMKVKVADIATDKPVWTVAKSKGVIVLTGNDWRAVLDKAGFTEVKKEVKEQATAETKPG